MALPKYAGRNTCKRCALHITLIFILQLGIHHPTNLMHGWQPVLPVDIQYGLYGTIQSHQLTSLTEYTAKLDQQLLSAFELANIGLLECTMNSRNSTMTRKLMVVHIIIIVGDLVWVLNLKVPRNSGKKLFHPWKGSFRIVKKLSECTYRILRQEGRRQRQVVHFNRLKPCRRDTRLDSRTQQAPSNSTEPSQARHNEMQAAAPPPFGTDLEIADYDDDVDNQHMVQNVDHNSRNIQNQPPVYRNKVLSHAGT